jgi:uncharacterized membrane protein (DUF2068 family)
MCDPPRVAEARDPARSRRVIRVIAAERFVRGVLLVVAGAYLVTHLGSDLGRLADRVMRAVELDPHRPFLRKIIAKLHGLHAGAVLVTGIGAILYGVLEGVEGAGLWLDKLWAEYLTVIATSLLVPFELYELARKPSVFKAGGILVNLVIVAYLAWRLRQRTSSSPSPR